LTVQFLMPALGADMTEGTLVEWRVQPGTAVKRGDIVALVETAKGIIDVESFHDGMVERLLIEPGAQVPVGTAMALFSGDAPPAPAQPATERTRISPAARRSAAAAGLALDQLAGSGPDGIVSLADVEHAIAERTRTAPTTGTSQKPGMRSAIAASMARAKREIPHYYLARTIDFSPAQRWLEHYNSSRPVEERLLYVALVIKAVGRAARDIPGFGGFFRNDTFEPAQDIHVGIAITQRGGGLVAPAILHAATKDLSQLMRELSDLVTRARSGHLRSSELALPVITLTSLGDEGVELVYPIIFPDQVAIVGAGQIMVRPWVDNGQVVPRPLLTLTLAADHRVTDGRAGARFLSRIAALLGTPDTL
jgi:pyruvate dehydrogenase E2 component (dihydrolipoamide acetyltransferase)